MGELPPKLRMTESASATPVNLSEGTTKSSADIANAIRRGDTPPAQSVSHLTSSVESDLQKGGVSLNTSEKELLERTVSNTFRVQQPEQASQEDKKQFEVSLPEYQKLFVKLAKTYGIDKQAVKFGAIEALMIQGKTIQSIAGLGMAGIGLTLWSNADSLPHTAELAWRFITPRLNPNARELSPQGMQVPIEINDQHITAAASEAKALWKTLKWPAAVALAYVPSVVAEYAGQLQLINAMKSVRRAVNDRAANSLFMRDMEFVHDKSAAEINNIIEKGKQSTIDFFTVTYKDVIPRLAAMGLGTVGQLPINPVGAILQLGRLPFLYGMSKSYASEVLMQRAFDLKRKDMIDTRINATLGSLEVVKTSDSMGQAIDQLKQNMTMRDEFQMSSSKQTAKQAAKMEAYNMAFGLGIPVVGAAIDFVRTGKWQRAATTGIIGGMSGNIIEKNARDLIDIYIDKIQPALQDIKRMEDLLGPYETLDKPDGIFESSRMSVNALNNFDISVRDLSYKDILHHVTLDIPQGAFVTLKGASGSGKTTLMRHMLGLFSSDTGTVSYGGTEMAKIKKFGDESIYSAIGYANQNPQFFENMTLKENLLLWTRKQITDDQVRTVLHDLRLDHLVGRLDSTVKHFSGGELRRIGIARALLKDPKVLFLDEPTANLDEASSKQVLDIIRNMRQTRPDMTVIAVTHDPNFEGIAEKIVDFRDVNKPTAGEQANLGTRQVFYANAKPS